MTQCVKWVWSLSLTCLQSTQFFFFSPHFHFCCLHFRTLALLFVLALSDDCYHGNRRVSVKDLRSVSRNFNSILRDKMAARRSIMLGNRKPSSFKFKVEMIPTVYPLYFGNNHLPTFLLGPFNKLFLSLIP